jgi:hypothetical protein
MKAKWLLQRPRPATSNKDRYLTSIDDGLIHTTGSRELGLTFTDPGMARAFANQHGERLLDWRVVKQ